MKEASSSVRCYETVEEAAIIAYGDHFESGTLLEVGPGLCLHLRKAVPTYFGEFDTSEVRRRPPLGTWVNEEDR